MWHGIPDTLIKEFQVDMKSQVTESTIMSIQAVLEFQISLFKMEKNDLTSNTGTEQINNRILINKKFPFFLYIMKIVE